MPRGRRSKLSWNCPFHWSYYYFQQSYPPSPKKNEPPPLAPRRAFIKRSYVHHARGPIPVTFFGKININFCH
jgi:hypothetical protein